MVSCQPRRRVPATTQTVVIGNGPSALFLSFLLHGNVPYYDDEDDRAHPDPILHRKLKAQKGLPLYHALKDVSHLCEHFEASGRYSADAWPVNVLLDTLLRPDDWASASTITFRYDAKYRSDHIILGSARETGGQWAEPSPQKKGECAKTLSYSEQLSLPGYSFAQFYLETFGTAFEPYERPRRPEVTAYYAAYPARVQVDKSIWNGAKVTSVIRSPDRIYTVAGTDSQGLKFSIQCRNVILACGLFTDFIKPPLVLSPYVGRQLLTTTRPDNAPIMIIGSGFSAADAIVENLGKRPVIHLFKWQSAQYISPLKHCHRSSYPEYADIYRRMKLSAQSDACSSPGYEGLADYEVTGVREFQGAYQVAIDKIESSSSSQQQQLPRRHRILVCGELVVLAGRRTSLDFFSADILTSLNVDVSQGWLEKTGLRDQIRPQGAALTVDAGRIACIGSITGDSLVKFMFGAAMGAAGRVFAV